MPRNRSFRKAIADAGLPPSVVVPIVHWVEFSTLPAINAGFLWGLIRNELDTCVQQATKPQIEALPAIVSFLKLYAPQGAFFEDRAHENWPLFVAAQERQNRMVLDEVVELEAMG